MESHRDSSGRKTKKQTIDVGFTYLGSPSRASSERNERGRSSRSRDDGSYDHRQNRNAYAPPAGSSSLDNAATKRPITTLSVAENTPPPPGLSTQPQRKLKPPPGFGSQLSSATGSNISNSSDTHTTSNSNSTLAAAPQSSNPTSTDTTPFTRDNDLNNQLTALLSTTPTSLSEIRESIRLFKSKSMSADELLGKMISLAMIGRGSPAKLKKETEMDVGRVWKQLADELESDRAASNTSSSMLRAWNDWRVKVSPWLTSSLSVKLVLIRKSKYMEH